MKNMERGSTNKWDMIRVDLSSLKNNGYGEELFMSYQDYQIDFLSIYMKKYISWLQFTFTTSNSFDKHFIMKNILVYLPLCGIIYDKVQLKYFIDSFWRLWIKFWHFSYEIANCNPICFHGIVRIREEHV